MWSYLEVRGAGKCGAWMDSYFPPMILHRGRGTHIFVGQLAMSATLRHGVDTRNTSDPDLALEGPQTRESEQTVTVPIKEVKYGVIITLNR